MKHLKTINEFKNSQIENVMVEWLQLHPLVNVTAYSKPLIPTKVEYYDINNTMHNTDHIFYVEFNSPSEYISAECSTVKVNVRCMLSNVTNPETLLSWLHKAMIFLQVPFDYMHDILKEVKLKIS